MIPKVVSWKKDAVVDLVNLLERWHTVAVIDIHGVPADSMIGMRSSLRENLAIRVAKKRLMRLAWERAGLKSEELEQLFDGAVQPALISSSSLNSFEMFSALKADTSRPSCKARRPLLLTTS